MRKSLLLIPIVALLAACGSTKDPYERRAESERKRQTKSVELAIKKAPKWMLEVPISDSAVYAAGTGRASDYSMAFKIARQDAYDKICMAANGTTSQRTKVYKVENDVAGSSRSESISRSSCKDIDITGVEIADKEIVADQGRYRAYVLVVLPTGDANVLRTAKEQKKNAELTATRANEAFNELD